MSLNLLGKVYYVPGVYSVTQIINLGGNQIPAFNIGVIIGKHQSLKPYTVGTGSTPTAAPGFILPFSDLASLTAAGGPEGDSEILTFARYAKSVGAGQFFALGVDPHTQAALPVPNATPVTAFTLKPIKWGATANDITLAITASVHTLTPTKNVTALTVNSGTGVSVSVKNSSLYHIGDTVYIASNAVGGYTPQALIVGAIDTTPGANTVTFTTAVTVSALVTDNARLFMDDTANQEVSSAALTTVALVQAFYASSKIVTCTMAPTVTLMPVTFASARLRVSAGVTLGTWVDATPTDWVNIANNFQRWNDEIAASYKFYMRVVGASVASATIHATLAAMATTMRTNGNPIKVVTGCALADYAAATSAANYPVVRAQTLNTDEILLAGAGLDSLDAYKTLAGEVFGQILAGNVGHNLTHGQVACTTVEKSYGQLDATYLTFVQSGVIMIQSTKFGYVLSQGVTTFQNQATTFDQTTGRTYLSACRDLADYDTMAANQALLNQVGADGVTANAIAIILNNLGVLELQMGIVIAQPVTLSIVKSGNGWIATRQVQIGAPTDFIGVITQIIVGS